MTGSEAKRQLEDYQPKIAELIRKFFDKEIKDVKDWHPFFRHMLAAAKRQILRGGKRIRPILSIQAYKAVGGRDIREAEKTSIGIEIFHTFLLMHDDIIDQDDLRHGGPAAHAIYREYHKSKLDYGESGHFGESVSLVLGDILASYCYRIVLDSKFPAPRRIAAVQHMNNVLKATGYGEIMDVLIGARGRASEKDILEVLEYKTARYTVESPLILGGILGGAPDYVQRAFSRYALPLGIAFQIQDDILGMFADEKKLGKPVGSDLQEGKQTLLVDQVRKKARPADRRRFDSILGKPDIRKADIKEARRIVTESGALDYSRDLAKKYALQAKRAIASAKIRKPEKEFFQGIATYIIEREF